MAKEVDDKKASVESVKKTVKQKFTEVVVEKVFTVGGKKAVVGDTVKVDSDYVSILRKNGFIK